MTHEDDLHHVRGIMTYEQLCRGEEFIIYNCAAIPLVDTITSL